MKVGRLNRILMKLDSGFGGGPDRGIGSRSKAAWTSPPPAGGPRQPRGISARGMKRCIASLALLAFAGCQPRPAESPNEIQVSGRIEGDEAMISSKVPGRVAAAPVREGDQVTAGQDLVRIASEQILARRDQSAAMLTSAERQLERARTQIPLLEEKLRQLTLRQKQSESEAAGHVANAEGQVAAAEANLARAESELTQAKSDAERLTALAAKEAVPEQLAEQQRSKQTALEAVVEAARKQVAAAKGGLEVARAAESNPEILAVEKAATEHQIREARSVIRAASAEVEAAKALAAQGEADVNELVIQAPFDGVVVTRAVEPGQVVGPGQTLVTVVDPKTLYLRAFVPESLIGRVRVGQTAEVYLDAAPDRALAAEVIRIDPQAMFTPENTYFRDDRVRQVVGVKILLKQNGGEAKLGMSAEGRILLAASE